MTRRVRREGEMATCSCLRQIKHYFFCVQRVVVIVIYRSNSRTLKYQLKTIQLSSDLHACFREAFNFFIVNDSVLINYLNNMFQISIGDKSNRATSKIVFHKTSMKLKLDWLHLNFTIVYICVALLFFYARCCNNLLFQEIVLRTKKKVMAKGLGEKHNTP